MAVRHISILLLLFLLAIPAHAVEVGEVPPDYLGRSSDGEEILEVIAINLKEPKKQFRKALRAYEDFEITFIHDRRGSVARNYGVKGIPHMVMVDVDGLVAYQHIGYSERALEGIVAEINALLLKNNLVGDGAAD